VKKQKFPNIVTHNQPLVKTVRPLKDPIGLNCGQK